MSNAGSYPVKPLVIIPSFNQRGSIEQLIPAIAKVDERLHILIVDSGSRDDTAGAVARLQENYYAGRLFLFSLPSGTAGLKESYVQGFGWGLAGGYDFLIQMQGDGRHNPGFLETMLRSAGQADVAMGSRYVSRKGSAKRGKRTRMFPRLGSLYARLILGVEITDFCGGFNGWSADVLRAIRLSGLKSNGCAFQIELKCRALNLGCRYIEFPIEEPRGWAGVTPPADVWRAFWTVWRLVFSPGLDRAGVPFSPVTGAAGDTGPAQPLRCPRCGSTKVIPNASVRVKHGESNSIEAYVDMEPGALVFKDRMCSDIVANICGECGHVELKAEAPQSLYAHYLQSIR